MSKSFKILLFTALLLVFAQSLNLFEDEKISFNPSQIQYESNELKDLETIDIRVRMDYDYHQDMVVGYNGTFYFFSEFNDSVSNIFDPETIEKETSFKTFMVDTNQHVLNTTCRFWKPEDIITIFCDANFNEKGSHSVRIGNQSLEYKNKYVINIIFYGEQNFNFQQKDFYLSFLYSAKQIININEGQSSYELKFKFNNYYDDIIYMYGEKKRNNYLFLDDCKKIEKELICKISKEKIEETLIFKSEEFRFMLINDTEGRLYCDFIYPITINYPDVKKIDINIKLEKVLGRITEISTPVAFETNVSEISNLISDQALIIQNSLYSYFKKVTGRKLMLITEYNSPKENEPIPGNESEIILNNIHYKYNFIIQPFKFNENITVNNEGARVNVVYPEKIDFTSSNSSIIRFEMYTPSLDTGIKLNPDSDSYLECEEVFKIKKCIVPESHFNGKESGYYNISHKNHAGDSNIYYALPLIHITLPEESITELHIEFEDNKRDKYIGYEGILNFVLDYNDSETNIFNPSDIEERTIFKTTIVVDEENTTNVICKLWKPINEKLNMFCKLSNNLAYGRYSFNLSSSSFYYNSKKYVIIQKQSLYLFQMNEKIPFLYSSKQVLNIDDNIETYNLTFKIGEYDHEILMIPCEGIGAIIILDECFVEGKELKCKIKKDTIEEYTSHNGQILSIYYNFLHSEGEVLDKDNNIRSIYGVYINYPLSKKDISVEIVKLLENNINGNSFIAYETNVKNINNVHSKMFPLTLSNGNQTECAMKKTIGISLTMICFIEKEGEFSLGQIEKQPALNDINIKYNFIIQPINNNEKCIISGYGGIMMFAIPKLLDFNLYDKITIDFGFMTSEDLRGIRLNPEANDLECLNINDIYKRCIVPKSHFTNKDNGYYYTHHANHNNKSIMFYESSPFKVNLSEIYISIKKENNQEKIFLAHRDGVFALVTDYNNKEKKIFNRDDDITFIGYFVSKEKHDLYRFNCSLWVPNDDNVRIICKHYVDDEDFVDPIERSDLYLQKAEVHYRNYTIVFDQNDVIEFELSDKNISFLYSEKQTININDEASYELKFKKEAYNKDPLYIYGSNNNYAILDDCRNDTKEIICKITKEKIEEILVYNSEKFKIGAMNEDLGVISFVNILDITINYENVKRQDIYLEIKEIIGGTTKKGIPVGLVTNVTDIPNFISAKFDDMKYFKKVSGRPLILFYNFSYEIDYIMGSNYTEEVVKDNIHYKYNFKIQKSTFEGHVSVKDQGTNILLSYPRELIYNDNEETFKIMYIMNEPNSISHLKLTPDALYDLKCKNLNKMKVCDVPKSHFDGKQSGNYYTYHYHRYLYSGYEMFYDSSPIKVTKPFEITIIGDYYTLFIGNKGKFYLKTDYNDTERNVFNDSNIEENTKFNISFSCGNINYTNISCNFWKTSENIIYIFCQLNEILSNEDPYIYVHKTKFVYNKLEINIAQKNVHEIPFIQLEKPIPFLYSKNQTINLEEGKDTYYLKFNAENYHNEILIIRHESVRFIVLDKCSLEQKELICPINRSELEEYYLTPMDFNIYYPYSGRTFIPMEMIDKVFINNRPEKIDLKITIKKLLEDSIDQLNYVPYEVETDVKNISNLVTNIFLLNFTDGNADQVLYCNFKKTNQYPLYLLCEALIVKNISIHLSEIKQEMPLNNIHNKYNFYIQPVYNNETINIKGNGCRISIIIPKTLDFYTNDTISIDIILGGYKNETVKGIRFNRNANKDLECEELDYRRRCLVPKSHFENQQSGYCDIYHLNHENEYIKFYEYSPIQVIFPSDSELIIRIQDNKSTFIGKKGFVSFVTDYIDSNDIFNPLNIETETKKKMIFSGIHKNYQADCYLWKLKSGEVRLICKFEEIIDTQTIKLNKFTFIYNKTTITLFCENGLNINQLNSDISFLYSDKQEINITENANEYNLIFKKGVYNKEPLILFSNDNNYMKNIYLNCAEETNEIKCSISKDKLVGILSKSGDEYCLYQLTQSEGILKLENVNNIKIYYSDAQQKIIYSNIIKILTHSVEKNNYVVFETNITNDIPIITTGYFKIGMKVNANNEWDCLFKKNQKDDKLLLLCRADSSGEYKFDITEKPLNDINILYSFIIPTTHLDEKITVSEKEGGKILSVYPESLDFNTQDRLTIRYQTQNPNKLTGIKLNNDSTTELDCTDKNGIKECTVPQSHFKEPGYYYTYYTNSLGDKVISYEIPKIQITLKKDDGGQTDGGSGGGSKSNTAGIIAGSVVGGVVLIAAIVIIIIVVKKKKSKSDEFSDGKGGNLLPNSNQVELEEGDKF